MFLLLTLIVPLTLHLWKVIPSPQSRTQCKRDCQQALWRDMHEDIRSSQASNNSRKGSSSGNNSIYTILIFLELLLGVKVDFWSSKLLRHQSWKSRLKKIPHLEEWYKGFVYGCNNAPVLLLSKVCVGHRKRGKRLEVSGVQLMTLLLTSGTDQGDALRKIPKKTYKAILWK